MEAPCASAPEQALVNKNGDGALRACERAHCLRTYVRRLHRPGLVAAKLYPEGADFASDRAINPHSGAGLVQC